MLLFSVWFYTFLFTFYPCVCHLDIIVFRVSVFHQRKCIQETLKLPRQGGDSYILIHSALWPTPVPFTIGQIKKRDLEEDKFLGEPKRKHRDKSGWLASNTIQTANCQFLGLSDAANSHKLNNIQKPQRLFRPEYIFQIDQWLKVSPFVWVIQFT